MNQLLCFILLGVMSIGLDANKIDRFSSLHRWIRKREAYNSNANVNNRFNSSVTSGRGQVYHSLDTKSSEAERRKGTTRVTITNSTGTVGKISRIYHYPFGKERTQYVQVGPDNRTRVLASGDGSSVGGRPFQDGGGYSRSQRTLSTNSSYGQSHDSRRPLSVTDGRRDDGQQSYGEDSRRREEERAVLLRQREELLRKRQEIEEMRKRQREEEEAVRKEVEEQRRKQKLEEDKRRQEEQYQRRREEKRKRLEEERRQQARGVDVRDDSRRVAEEERRRIEEERRRRYNEQARRRQQQESRGTGETSTQSYYGYLTASPRVIPGENSWNRGGNQYPQTNQGVRTYIFNGTQYTYWPGSGQQPVSRGGYQGFRAQYEYGGYGQGQYDQEESSDCPEVGVEMRINGMDCQNAIRTYGTYLCYAHELTSRQCCEICKQIKQPSNVGCEYGDHVDNCKILSPSDCYDLRNRHSCCATCERFKKLNALPECEYGDAFDRCDSVRQNPGLCYVPNNQRSCCETCSQVKNMSNPTCAYGDYMQSLCQNYESNTSGTRVNCYSPHRRKICCQTCERIREWASVGMPADCQYGDRPILFYYPQYGRLTCSNMFQFVDVSECRNNPVVATNCCYTCNRYINQRG